MKGVAGMKYFVGFMASVIIIIIMLLVSLGNSGKKPATKSQPKTLVSYANTDASVRMIIDGPVTADQTHYQIRVNVSRDKTIYEQINGYEGNVIKSEAFENNQNSFSNFLSALEKAGYMRGDKQAENSNYLGYCPLGNRYIFSLSKGSEKLQQYWATSCGSPSTYLGSLNLTLKLFKAQVPDYYNLSDNLNL